MKKYTLILGIALLSFFTVKAQPSTNSIFWEISGQGLSNPSYLFGTHHLYDYQFIEQNDSILTALESVDMVLGEITIDSSQMAKVYMQFAMSMMMPPGKTLDKLLSEEEFKAVDACMKENLGMGVKTFNTLKPIFVQQLITVAKYMKVEGKKTDVSISKSENPLSNSMDGFFQSEARRMSKEVKGLETVDDQLNALYNSHSLEEQAAMLVEMVMEEDSSNTEQVVEMTKMYGE